MEAGFPALRGSPALGVCVALACSLAIAAPALAGSPAPDPSPAPAPDPYAAPAAATPVATTPLRPRDGRPAVHEVIRATAPSSTQAPAAATGPKHVAPHHAPTAVTTRAPAPPPRSIPTGPVRLFAGVVAAEVESTHHLSRTLALSVALLVLLSGAFVLTAAREVAR